MRLNLSKGINYIPTLPEVLAQILALLNDPKSSAGDLEKIITHDQALSSKVLAVANSAYYGFRHEILTVRRAVVALGYEEIRNVCLGASLMGYLHPSTFRRKQAAELLWLHSLIVAEASRIAAEVTKAHAPDPAYSAGLLHDLGKVVLAAFFPDEVDALNDLMEKEGLTYREAERAHDIDHCELGEALSDMWQLPPQFGETMGKHHAPARSRYYPELVTLAHAGDYLGRKINVGHSGNPDPPDLDLEAWKSVGADERTLKTAWEKLHMRREPVISLWKMLLTDPVF